jgi:hypothetical protein
LNTRENEVPNIREEEEVDPGGSPNGQRDIEMLEPQTENPILTQMTTQTRNTSLGSPSEPTEKASAPPIDLSPPSADHPSDRTGVDEDAPIDRLSIGSPSGVRPDEAQPPPYPPARALSINSESYETPTERGNTLPTTPPGRPPVSLSGPTSVPKPSKANPPPVQMVLCTKGASWNLQRDREEESSEPPRKKRRSDVELIPTNDGSIVARTQTHALLTKEKGTVKDGKAAAVSLRSSILGFARSGSQLPAAKVGGGFCGDNGGKVCGKERRPTHYKEEVTEDDMEIDELDELSDDQIENGVADQGIKPFKRKSGSDHPMTSNVIDLTDKGVDDVSMLDTELTLVTTHPQASSEEPISQPEIIRTSDDESVSLRFDLSKISDIWSLLRERLSAAQIPQPDFSHPKSSIDKDAGFANTDDDSKAADVLSRVIDKEDFGKMEVIGQFNKGFIIARRCETCNGSMLARSGQRMDDLFIIDQHAADEKYNFETLQLTTYIQSQKLFR